MFSVSQRQFEHLYWLWSWCVFSAPQQTINVQLVTCAGSRSILNVWLSCSALFGGKCSHTKDSCLHEQKEIRVCLIVRTGWENSWWWHWLRRQNHTAWALQPPNKWGFFCCCKCWWDQQTCMAVKQEDNTHTALFPSTWASPWSTHIIFKYQKWLCPGAWWLSMSCEHLAPAKCKCIPCKIVQTPYPMLCCLLSLGNCFDPILCFLPRALPIIASKSTF